jgi:hypothetical protein
MYYWKGNDDGKGWTRDCHGQWYAPVKGKGRGKGKGIRHDIFVKDKPTISPTPISTILPSEPTTTLMPTAAATSPSPPILPTDPPDPVTTSTPSVAPTTPQPVPTSTPTQPPLINTPNPTLPPTTLPTSSPTIPNTNQPTQSEATARPTTTEEGQGIFRVPNSGFNITFFTTREEFVTQEQFDDLVGLSLQYLGDYMRTYFQNTDEYANIGQSTRVRGTAFRFQSGVPLLHNYAGVFRNIRTIPTTQDIDMIIEPAFTEPDAVAEYIALIQTLPPENPFSETFRIEYALVGGGDDAPDIDIPGQQSLVAPSLSTQESSNQQQQQPQQTNSFGQQRMWWEIVVFAVGLIYFLIAILSIIT